MRLPEDTICNVCQSVFCCAQCRHKHEIKNHAIVVRKPIMINNNNITATATTTTSTSTSSLVKQDDGHNTGSELQHPASYEEIYLFCPICEKRPLPLQNEIYAEMLVHLETHHLPLRCEKCAKMYYNIDDLKEFTKCMRPSEVCQSMSSNQSCNTDDASKVTVTRGGLQSTQVTPMRRQDFNDSHMTPISIINMRWKAKSKASHEEFISDSVSSIKNISSISNSSIRRSVGVTSAVKGKVIRSTSTPVHLEMVFAKPKEHTFNATGAGHMSSIYNSGCESDISPALPQPSSQALEPVNRYRKVGSARPRMSAVTPLRQVMSKSIQKAFAEHGLPTASTAVRGSSAAFQRKKIFDSTSSPSLDGGPMSHQSPGPPALDLRLSPAVRRSHSESEEALQLQISADQQRLQRNDLPNMRRKILLSAQKLTTESIVITRTEHLSSVSSSSSTASSNGSINSVKPHSSTNSSYQSATSNNSGGIFKSCRSSVEIITATTEQIQQIQSVEAANCVNNPLPPITPITRIPGAIILKKLIKFETPKIESRESRESQSSPCDVFFTPNATPIRKSSLSQDRNEKSADIRNRKRFIPQNLSGRFSPPRRPSIKECAHSTAFSRIENITDTFDEDIDDEVFVPEETDNLVRKPEEAKKKPNKSQTTNGLWSLMSSVMGLPSRKGSNSKLSPKNESSVLTNANSNSILKRCSSIAGSLVRSKPLVDENELQTLKRKRTFTTSEQSSSAYLAQLHNSEANSPNSDSFNTSSKRFRIQGRRPIERMRFNS